jgi:hypothetical protein
MSDDVRLIYTFTGSRGRTYFTLGLPGDQKAPSARRELTGGRPLYVPTKVRVPFRAKPARGRVSAQAVRALGRAIDL